MTIKEVQERINYFVVKHIYILVVIWAITILNINIGFSNNEKTIKEMGSKITQMQQSYIAIDELGRLMNLPRTYVLASDQEERIGKILSALLVDVVDISENFKITKLVGEQDVINNSLALQTFYFDYIKIDRGKNEKLVAKEQKALGYFLAYRQNIFALFKGRINDSGRIFRLPHKIKILDQQILAYAVNENENSFTIEVQYTTTNSEFDSSITNEEGKTINLWKDVTAVSIVKATGYFDVTTQNIGTSFEGIKGSNFDGLHFETFNVSLGL